MATFGSAVDFLRVPSKRFVPEKSATAPTTPVSGQLWVDTSVTPNVLRYYDGTVWVAANGTSIPDGYISNTQISPTAAISLNKLATDPLARANHTGAQLAATISDFDTRVRTNRLDQLAAPTTTLDANAQRISNVATPLNPSDAANRKYVDDARSGVSVKDPVRVVAQGNVNLAAPGAQIDGVTLTAGDRFLAPRQTVGTESGLYSYAGAAAPAVRSTDADSAGEVLDGSMVAVSEGTDAGYQYIQTASATGAPGSWSQTWIVFKTGGQTYVAGNGLSLTGTTFAISAPVSVANGGTGATTPYLARFNLGAVTSYYGAVGALVAGQTATIVHNLNIAKPMLHLAFVADGKPLMLDWAATSATTITLYPDVDFANGVLTATVFA